MGRRHFTKKRCRQKKKEEQRERVVPDSWRSLFMALQYWFSQKGPRYDSKLGEIGFVCGTGSVSSIWGGTCLYGWIE